MRGIAKFLRSRGWKRYLGSWWYKPLSGWGRPAPNQVFFGTAGAFAEERARLVTTNGATVPVSPELLPDPRPEPTKPGPRVA